MVSGNDISAIFERHVKMVYRLCYSYLGSAAEAEDATQSVFIKLVEHPRAFEDVEHEKAWLIVAARNLCKDILKSARVKKAAPMPEDLPDTMARDEADEILEALFALPAVYKDCLYLHYYEGYKTDEIARMTGTPPSTVRNRLSDGRSLLRKALGADRDE